MNIPLVDLKQQYDALQAELSKKIDDVFKAAAFAGGPFVEEFEKDFALYCRTKHAVGVGSGTDALWLALICLGVGPGDEVITTPHTFIATAEAISFAGATPVFADIDPAYHTIDPSQIEKRITPKTRAIIPVHIYGHMADMDAILDVADSHRLFVIEDACQAHGAEYKGRRAGSIGHAGCFSFYPGKNLGAYGEAGAVVTNNDALAFDMKRFRDHGQAKKYHHAVIGWNARMDGIQGAVLSVKLKHLEKWNELRRNRAQLYQNLLPQINQIVPPAEASFAKSVYHIYSIRSKERDALLSFLNRSGIMCGIHYPLPIHLQDAYRFLGYKEDDFPVTEKYARECLSLPLFPELTDDQIHEVIARISEFYNSTQSGLQ